MTSISLTSDLQRAVDVANNVARQCGESFRLNAEIQYVVEFPNHDYHQFGSEEDAVDAIIQFNASVAEREALRRLKFVDPDLDFQTRQALEAEVDLIIERAQ